MNLDYLAGWLHISTLVDLVSGEESRPRGMIELATTSGQRGHVALASLLRAKNRPLENVVGIALSP